MKIICISLIVVICLIRINGGMFASAKMFLQGTNDSIGTVVFYQDPDIWGVVISGLLDRLRPMATLGFHIHYGSIGDNHNCTSGVGHFNPYNVSHGMNNDSILERHVGDLGNIEINSNGSVYIDSVDPIISLLENNQRNVINLSLMIHNLTDDGGHTGKGESSINGNVGPAIACGTIYRGA